MTASVTPRRASSSTFTVVPMCRQALRTGLSVAGKITLNVPDRHVPGPVVGGGLGTVDPTELGADDGCEEDGGRAVPVPAVPPAAVTGGVVPVPEAAVTGLRRAIILVPQDPTLRMRMGVELVRAGELPLAKTILAPVAFDPHGSGKNPYAKLLKAINDGATPAELGAKLVELKIDRFNEFTPPSNDEDKPAEGGDNTKDGKKAGN